MSSNLKVSALCACLWLICMHAAAADNFSAAALRGVTTISVAVDGVDRNFVRYGLTTEKLRDQSSEQLARHGLTVVDERTAAADAAASQVSIRLRTATDSYGMYSYGLSVRLNRKVPLDSSGTAYVPSTVWSEGQNGILNPSDLPRIYDIVYKLLDQFVQAYNRHNRSTTVSAPG